MKINAEQTFRSTSVTLYTEPGFADIMTAVEQPQAGDDGGYFEVVAVDSPLGEIACQGVKIQELEETAEPFTVYASRKFALRLSRFFRDKIVPHDPMLPRDSPTGQYSCHVFAWAMNGKDITREDFAARARSRIESRFWYRIVDPMQPLPMGAHGVVFDQLSGRPDLRRPIHSTVGLGKEVPYCLQVDRLGGRLAIMTYERMWNRYSSGLRYTIPLFAVI